MLLKHSVHDASTLANMDGASSDGRANATVPAAPDTPSPEVAHPRYPTSSVPRQASSLVYFLRPDHSRIPVGFNPCDSLSSVKAGLAPYFGCSPSCVQIVCKGSCVREDEYPTLASMSLQRQSFLFAISVPDGPPPAPPTPAAPVLVAFHAVTGDGASTVTLAVSNPLVTCAPTGFPGGLPQRLLVRHGVEIQDVPVSARDGATVNVTVHGVTVGVPYRYASSYQVHPDSGYVGEVPWSAEVEVRLPTQPRAVAVVRVTTTEVEVEAHNPSWRDDALRPTTMEVQYGGDLASLEAAIPQRVSLTDTPHSAAEHVAIRYCCHVYFEQWRTLHTARYDS